MTDFFSNLPTLETERLILRKLKLSDAPDIFQFTKKRSITKFLTWEAHKSITDTEDFLSNVLKKYETGEPAQWVIELVNTNIVIGIAGFIAYSKIHQKAEIAYILSEEYVRKGYMTEALKEILNFGFNQLDLNRIDAKCEKDNFASEKVMQKLGMSFEGFFKDYLFIKGQLKDFKFYSILKKDFVIL